MADSALVTDINKVISDFFSSKSAGGTSTSTGAVIATSRKEVLVLPAQQIQILSIGYTSLVDIAIYVENANILPDNPINTTVNTVQLTMTDANSTAASTLSLNNKNAIFTASNRRLSTLTITNNYAVNITLSVHYTVKEYNPDLITTSGNIQQVIGDVNVISQQNVAPPIVGTINAISGIGSSVTATNISNFPTCLVTVNGTYSGITIQFTISDDNGVTFYGANAYELTSGRATQSWALPDNLKDAFYVPIIGADQLKVSVTAYGSGTLNVNITPISTAVSEYIHVGQATMANSEPVVIASDQSALNVAVTTYPILVGQETMANSEPVVVASDQSNIGSSLNAINGNPLQVVPLGQAIMNDSIPVTMASDQSTFNINISGVSSDLPVYDAPFSVFDCTQATIGITATQLPNIVTINAVLKADDNNNSRIFIGGATVTTVTGFPLAPGAAVNIQITNTNILYAIAAVTGQKLDIFYGVS